MNDYLSYLLNFIFHDMGLHFTKTFNFIRMYSNREQKCTHSETENDAIKYGSFDSFHETKIHSHSMWVKFTSCTIQTQTIFYDHGHLLIGIHSNEIWQILVNSNVYCPFILFHIILLVSFDSKTAVIRKTKSTETWFTNIQQVVLCVHTCFN